MEGKMADHKQAWEIFQKKYNQYMGKHPQSPLSKKQQKLFNRLPTYEWNEAYLVEATAVLFPKDFPSITMQTSTGDPAPYQPYARLSFTIAGQDAQLTVYSEDGKDLFLPFKDKTNGVNTYGAGRYLDNNRNAIWQEVEGKWMIDFNYAYNPYCAYSNAYSCPLPPNENWLSIDIEAGEKAFK